MSKDIRKRILMVMAVFTILMTSSITASARTVAKIGNKSYPCLASAYAAAKSGQTIKLTRDITYKDLDRINGNKYLSLLENKRITLDLNKKTISGGRLGEIQIYKGSITIKNGTLKNVTLFCFIGSKMKLDKIKFNGGNKTITNSGSLSIRNSTLKTSRTEGIFLNSSGKLTLRDTKIIGSYADNLISGNEIIYLSDGSRTVIHSGTYSAGDGGLIELSGLDSSLTINGGTFKGKIKNLSTTKIYDGTFKVKKEQTIENNGTMTIYGGMFKSSSSCMLNNDGKLTIKGGSFAATGRLKKTETDGYNTYPGTIYQGSSASVLTLKEGEIYSRHVSGIYCEYKGKVTVAGGTVRTDSTNREKYPEIKR